MTPTNTARAVVRRQVFSYINAVDDVMSVLWKFVRERHTGTVTVNMSQGGINGVTAEDKTPLGDSKGE